MVAVDSSRSDEEGGRGLAWLIFMRNRALELFHWMDQQAALTYTEGNKTVTLFPPIDFNSSVSHEARKRQALKETVKNGLAAFITALVVALVALFVYYIYRQYPGWTVIKTINRIFF